MNSISFLFALKKEERGLIFTEKFPIKRKLSPLTEVVYYIKNLFPGNFSFYPKFSFNRFPIIQSTLYYSDLVGEQHKVLLWMQFTVLVHLLLRS